jgi:putative transposase
MITDKLKSYAAAKADLGLVFEHRQHKGLNNRAENSHQPTRVREKVMRRFKSACHLQRFVSVHDQVANVFQHCRYNRDAKAKRDARTQALQTWGVVSCAQWMANAAA